MNDSKDISRQFIFTFESEKKLKIQYQNTVFYFKPYQYLPAYDRFSIFSQTEY